MKIGEVWRFKEDGCLGKIVNIEFDPEEEMEMLIYIDPLSGKEEDEFADYYRKEFLRKFERVYKKL